MGAKSRFFLIDGNSLIYRACFSPAPMLRSESGKPTKGPYIFLRTLIRMVREWSPIDYMVVALDGPRELLHRKKIDPDYKGNREGNRDPEIYEQFKIAVEMLAQLQIPAFAVRGFEADDLLAALVYKFGKNMQCFVCTSDKDLHQLVRHNVQCLDLFEQRTWDVEAVEERWGVKPERVTEVLTLCGDKTDGVVGVRGLGTKVAADLISRFGTALDAWRAAPDMARGLHGQRRGAKNLMKVTEDHIRKTRKLVQLYTDVPLPYGRVEELRFPGLLIQECAPYLRGLGFRRFDVPDRQPPAPEVDSVPGFV